MSDQLLRTIKEVRRQVQHRSLAFKGNEAQTRMDLIDPILIALGWRNDPRTQIRVERRTGSGKVDYLLTLNGNTEILVEAKPLDNQLGYKEREQLCKYCYDKQISTAVLTNGVEWLVYRPLLALELKVNLEFKDRCIIQIRLDENDVEASTRQLNRLNCDQFAKLKDTDLNSLLDKYWNSKDRHMLLHKFSEAMCAGFSKWAGTEVPYEKTEDYLRRKLDLRGTQSTSNLEQHSQESPSRDVVAIELEGERVYVASFRDILFETAKWLVRRGDLNRPVRIDGAENDLVNHKKEHSRKRRKHLRQLTDKYYIYVNFSPENSIEQACRLLEHFDYQRNILEVIEHGDEV